MSRGPCIYCCGDHFFTMCPEPLPEPVILRPTIHVVAVSAPNTDITPEEFEFMQRNFPYADEEEPPRG